MRGLCVSVYVCVSVTDDEYGRHMESVAEVPEEASGLCHPRFWIRVFLLLDRLPAKANEPCRLGSSLPLSSEYVSLETWDDGARRLLTLKTSRRRLGGQPAVGT